MDDFIKEFSKYQENCTNSFCWLNREYLYLSKSHFYTKLFCVIHLTHLHSSFKVFD